MNKIYDKELELLLQQLQQLEIRRRQSVERQRIKGNLFNVFDVLKKYKRDERYTHSAFIGNLLNVKGEHGCGDAFLNAFIETLHISLPNGINTDDAETCCEYYIGPINSNYTEGGFLDVLVQLNGYAIVIENKVDAQDQPGQVMRYCIFLDKKYHGNGRVLYLTKYGTPPSDNSKGDKEENVNYLNISYREHITKWIEKCIAIAKNKPFVLSILKQYLHLIKEITNQNMEQTEIDKLYKIAAKYPEAAIALFWNADCISFMKYIYNQYVNPLFADFAKKNDLVYDEFITRPLGNAKGKGFCFRRENWKQYAIFVWSDCTGYYDWTCFYDGVSPFLEYGAAIIATKDRIKLDCMTDEPTDGFPYGSSYLSKYKDWNGDTVLDMMNGEFTACIIERVKVILEEVEERKLLIP